MNTPPQQEPAMQDKTPYQTPEIVDFGRIESATQAGGSSSSDPLPGSVVI